MTGRASRTRGAPHSDARWSFGSSTLRTSWQLNCVPKWRGRSLCIQYDPGTAVAFGGSV